MTKNEEFAESDIKILITCIILAVIIFIVDSLIPLGVAGGVPYILVVLVSLRSSKIKMPVYMAIGGSLLTLIGFYVSPPGGELWKVLANRTLALFAIWSSAILGVQLNVNHQKKEQALLNLKKLHGLLPICASCKKIRDDKGYWNQIELYIRDHSEAEFSHGLCPDCAQKYFTDLELPQNVKGKIKE